jgi:hypothetical protein
LVIAPVVYQCIDKGAGVGWDSHDLDTALRGYLSDGTAIDKTTV